MTPEEKPSSAEMAAEAIGIECYIHPVNQISGPQPTQRFADFLAGAQWQAAQVAEAVGKLEKLRSEMLDYRKKTSPSEDRHEMGHAVSATVLDEIDAALALLKEGTK